MNNLPSEIINEILCYLNYNDLVNCSRINKRFNGLVKQDIFWKKLCNKYWLDTKCPRNKIWKEHFANWYQDMGPYIDDYAEIKTTWNKMINYLQTQCPTVYRTIKGGASEEQLDELESALGHKLPKDFRCSYRIHNGQRSTYAGLMGNCYHYQTSQRLLDIEKIKELIENQTEASENIRGCIPVTFYAWYASAGHIAQYLAVCDCDGYKRNCVFHLAYKVSSHEDDAFICGNSFKEWIMSYADHLSSNHFLLQNGRISRFRTDPVCEEVMGHMKISIMVSFQPEISQVTPPHFEFDYRVVLFLSEDAPETESSILHSSIWITDNGKKREIFRVPSHRDPKVLKPGGSVTWASIATVDSIHGTLTGNVHLESISSGQLKIVHCPVAPLNCFPFINAEERKVKSKESTCHYSEKQ